ncbi:MAG TPA: TPM domain-containing protein [bacterium]
MKKRLFLLFPLLIAFVPNAFSAQHWPAPTGYVNDFAHVIPQAQAQALENLLTELQQKTGAQVSVVTVPSVEGADIDGAAVDLFKAWGIGKKGKDNGVLILAAINDHKARIEVGYGLEGLITDGTSGEILRKGVFPQFKQGNYGQGLTNGTAAVAQMIAQNAGVVLNGRVSVQNDSSNGGGLGFWGTIVLFLVFFFLISALNRRGRGGYWGGFYGGGFGGGGFGGGGGGGFGGFGGGGSGGGGASGSW